MTDNPMRADFYFSDPYYAGLSICSEVFCERDDSRFCKGVKYEKEIEYFYETLCERLSASADGTG